MQRHARASFQNRNPTPDSTHGWPVSKIYLHNLHHVSGMHPFRLISHTAALSCCASLPLQL